MQKNQKSITQFFSQKQQKSPNKCGLSQTENYDKNSAKRKRLSPIQSQNADRPDEPRSTNSTNILHSTGLNTKKKIKLDHKSPLKITAHETDKTTPKKENSNTTSLSPRKCSNNIKNSKGDGKNTKENDDISRSKNSNKDDVVEVNKLASTFEQNDKLNKVKSLINGNIVNKVVKTPRKVLEFHDCVQNGIIKNKKSVTAQNTPEKGNIFLLLLKNKYYNVFQHLHINNKSKYSARQPHQLSCLELGHPLYYMLQNNEIHFRYYPEHPNQNHFRIVCSKIVLLGIKPGTTSSTQVPTVQPPK